ncbi:MAG TPA: acetate--CoA ligase family protein [Eoetvoesiella sp.]
MDPKSVLIVGMSSRKGSVGHLVLQNLKLNGFNGQIYLLGRNAGEIEGIQIHTDSADIPNNIDLAVLTVPAAGVEDSIGLCITKRISAVITLAGGFAELGEEGREAQNRILALAREGGLSVIGPNCLGFSNFTNSFMIGFVKLTKLSSLPQNTNDAVAIVGQSGGVQSHLYQSLESRGVSVSYTISTGNEMDLGLGDFVNYLIQDPFTRVIAIYAEHIGNPERFIWAAREAAKNGKPIVLLHSGRSVKAQEAAKSHTGSLVGNHAIMSARLRREGIVLVETLDELLDVTELLSRYPLAKKGGLGVMSFSGAFSGIAHDLCADIGIEIPELSHEVKEALRPQVPAFIPPNNPLDLGTQPLFQPELICIGLTALLDEPSIGAVVAVLPLSAPELLVAYLRNIIQAQESTDKPIGIAILNDGQPLPQEFINLARDHKIVISRSPDRTIRGMAKLINRGNLRKISTEPIQLDPLSIPKLESGVQVEWFGKQVLRAAGVSVPEGKLVRSIDDAVQAAVKIGYPVVLKAQSAKLAHKTEAGGVAINLKDEASLRTAWEKMTASVHRVQPDLTLDGMLVEAMSSSGLELVIGATRDPEWGPMVMVGIGGIHVEVLNDVRLIAPEADASEILDELNKLKMAKLLHGFRNHPPVDVEAVALAVTQIGKLMLSQPSISEIDVNPLMVQARGQGATALDALIVVD